jgi:hypothetical protein
MSQCDYKNQAQCRPPMHVFTVGDKVCQCGEVSPLNCFNTKTGKGIVIVEDESVNHPKHYNSGKIEVIDFIEDQGLDFHLGNAVKYICRAGKKDAGKKTEDLQKAQWYINRWIELQRKGDTK